MKLLDITKESVVKNRQIELSYVKRFKGLTLADIHGNTNVSLVRLSKSLTIKPSVILTDEELIKVEDYFIGLEKEGTKAKRLSQSINFEEL